MMLHESTQTILHKRAALLLAFLAMACAAKAQVYVGLHGGAALPTGYYGESCIADNGWLFDGSNGKMAGVGAGFAAGIDVAYALPFHTNLEVLLKAQYLQNGCNRNLRTHFNEAYPKSVGTHSSQYGYAVTLPTHRNVALQTGLCYAYPVAKCIDLYGEALCGIAFRLVSPFVLTVDASNYQLHDGQIFDNYNNRENYTYSNSLAFSCQGGAGFLIAKCVTLGASFLWLGSRSLSWQQHQETTYSTGDRTQTETADTHTDFAPLSPTLVLIHLGYRFPVWNGDRHVQDY